MAAFPTISPQIAALLSALFWALGIVLLKKGEQGSVTTRNLFRHILATLFFGVVLFTCCVQWQPLLSKDWMLLGISSLFGIVLSETFFLKSLQLMGAGKTTLITMLYSPIVVLFSVVLLNESLSLLEIIGGLLMLTATLFVLQKGKKHFTPLAITYALFSVVTSALGTIVLKPLFTDLPILQITFMRLALSLVPLFMVNHFRNGSLLRDLATNFKENMTLTTITGILLADGVAILFWMISLKEGSVAHVTLLGQSAPLLVLLLSATFLKEKLPHFTPIALLGSIIGAVLLIYS